MKWNQFQRNFKQDPWLRDVLFHSEICRTSGMPDEKLQRSIVECSVTHLMFRGGIELLRIDSKPFVRLCSIDTGFNLLGHDELFGRKFDDYTDELGYGVNYFLVAEVLQPHKVIVEYLSTSPARYGDNPKMSAIRWGAVNLEKRLQKKLHIWRAVVRNVYIISQGEFLMNGYDVFNCPEGFNPMYAGWHNPTRASVLA